MKRIFVVLALVLTGCVSSGPVFIGQGTYMITQKSAGCGFSSGEGTKASLYVEANAFCTEQGKQLETVNVIVRDGVPGVRCASAELQFRCVPAK
jgi:hypothetical protein